MKKAIGIRFKTNGKIYDFDACDFEIKCGDSVIVETEQGLGFGIVVTEKKNFNNNERNLKKVIRIATQSDMIQKEHSLEMEKTAFEDCLTYIDELKLEMNLFSVESNFDSTKMTFYFTAEGRVDFRELVKMLVRNFRIKIEMRQVGVRNQAKMWGGIGRCGREICCTCFLNQFDPVSIKMAKEQNLSLNPTKISGLCGRLMCCLDYEYKTYRELKVKFPKCGKLVSTKNGPARIIRHNVIRDKVTVRYESGNETEINLNDIKIID